MPEADVTGWVLAGGEGRRMGGVNKGLQLYRGQPLAWWVIQALKPQVSALQINANREQPAYAQLLAGDVEATLVCADAPDISGSLGPLAGILTGLRHITTPWMMVAACDLPHLPPRLVQRLHQHTVNHQADIAVPVTRHEHGEAPHHHWTCALIHSRTRASLEAALAHGERRVGQWIKSQRWIGVSFDEPEAFMNINTLETLHGQA